MPVFQSSRLTNPLPGRILRSGLRHEQFLLIAFETRDPHDPTSPRREASLFDSPGLLARRLFFVPIVGPSAAWGCGPAPPSTNRYESLSAPLIVGHAPHVL